MLIASVPYATPTEMNGVIDPTDQWYTGRPGHLPGTATVWMPPGVHGADLPFLPSASEGLLWGLAGAVGVTLTTALIFWAAGTKRVWTPGLVAGGLTAAGALYRYVWG